MVTEPSKRYLTPPCSKFDVNSVVFHFSNNIECLNPIVSEITLLHSLLSATVAVSTAVTVPFISHRSLESLFDILVMISNPSEANVKSLPINTSLYFNRSFYINFN